MLTSYKHFITTTALDLESIVFGRNCHTSEEKENSIHPVAAIYSKLLGSLK